MTKAKVGTSRLLPLKLVALCTAQFVIDLFEHIPPGVIRLRREQEQAAAVTRLLPLEAHWSLLPGVVIGLLGLALALDDEHPSIRQLGDEIGVEVVR